MARIRLYANTGFNGVDIPDSIGTLTHGDHEIMEYYDLNIGTAICQSILKVDISDNDAYTVDMAVIRDDTGLDVAYTVLAVAYIAPNTYEYYIKMAALTTILEDLTVISANANRMHVSDDDETFYTNPEPFSMSESPSTGTTVIDERFVADQPYVNILETVVAPTELIENSTTGTIQGTNKVVQENYTNDNTFATTKKGAKYRNTTPVVTTIEDANNSILSQSALSSIEPEFRPIINTIYTLKKLFGGQSAISIGSNYWINGAQSVVNNLTAVGSANGVTNYWAVPAPYIEGVGDSGFIEKGPSAGGVSTIGSTEYTRTVPLNGPIYGAFKNNKCYYGQDYTITIFNPVSGAMLTRQVWEIRDEEQTPGSLISATYSICADIRPDGSPIFAWKCKNGGVLDGFPETIEGGNWRKIPISANTYNGSYWDRRNLEMQKKLNFYGDEEQYRKAETVGYMPKMVANIGSGLGMGAAADAFGIGSGFGLPMAAIGGAIGSIFNTAAKRSELDERYRLMTRAFDIQQVELNNRSQVATPVLTLSTSNYLRELGFNTFYWLVTSYSENDLHAFDTFLTKYGYNVGNKKFEYEDFFSRQHFNYVRLNSIIMKSDYPMALRMAAEEELQRGVRIWHEYPTTGAIEDGNPVA